MGTVIKYLTNTRIKLSKQIFYLSFPLLLCHVYTMASTKTTNSKSSTFKVQKENIFLDQNLQSYNKIKERLEYYNLTVPETTFTYSYQAEVFASNLNESFELDPQIEGFAKAFNLRLNHSIFFDPEFIINSQRVRNYQLKPKYFKHNVGQLLKVKTSDNQIIPCTFFNRESDKLLVVGEGFTNEREVMSPFIDMFENHDVVIFDYRGHGFDPTKLNLSPTKMLFGVDCSKAMLGADEEKDVFAVIDTLKKKKNYTQINGLGICYSALIFVKATAIKQEKKEKLFDHLILDGCWLSLGNFVDKLIKDPKRICSPQYGGWERTWPIKKLWFQNAFLSLGQELFHTKINQISILDYLPKIENIPILYFYGKDDLVITRHEFEIMWHTTKTKEKTVIITSNPHVRNHLKQKELYKLICDLFLELPHNQFISCLQNKENLITYQASKLAYRY